MKEGNMICSECGAVLNEEYAHHFDGQVLCEDCLRRLTVTCDNCGDRIWRNDAEGNDTYTLCGHCYDNHYTNCEDCGRLIHLDNRTSSQLGEEILKTRGFSLDLGALLYGRCERCVYAKKEGAK